MKGRNLATTFQGGMAKFRDKKQQLQNIRQNLLFDKKA